MSSSGSGFAPIQWSDPLDAEAYLNAVPAGVTVKGMFITRLLDDAANAGVTVEAGGPYRGFKDYPLQEMMTLMLRLATTMHAELPLRDALRRLGRTAFPALMQSMIGKVIFAPVGRNMAGVLRLASKGYAVSLSVSNVRVHELDEPRAVIVRLADIYNFADSFQVGVFEGAFAYYDHEPTIAIKRHSLSDVELLVRWV
ncbi:MAG: DUF2378 family protein [Myxococcota bacterium]